MLEIQMFKTFVSLRFSFFKLKVHYEHFAPLLTYFARFFVSCLVYYFLMHYV